ncbi:MAG: alpha/beta fold hydrolase [Clostridia bacterium]|nr:alpha/beta fold hydrolase [Clostridia bacterium]
MDFTKTTIKMPSSDKIHTLKGVIYLPNGTHKGVFHLVHGMTEHIGRYDWFMSTLAQNGYIVAGYDNLGHGHSVNNDSELGFIAKKKGYKLLAEDVYLFGEKLRKNNKGLPFILMGHSMGSFIVRLAAALHPEGIDKLIICGTGGPNPMAPIGLLLADILALFKGKKAFSPLLDNMAFGKYNDGFEGRHDYEWLTKDQDIIEKHKDDKYCHFNFSISAMHDLVKLNYLTNKPKYIKKLRDDMPIFLVSGSDDPVGDKGKGVNKVYVNYKKYGKDVKMKIYENCRHEIHNDTCKDEMIEDLLEFMK